MSVAWNDGGVLAPPYWISRTPLTEEVPAGGADGLWLEVPYTPVGTPYDQRPAVEGAAATHAYLGMANLHHAFYPEAPYKRFPGSVWDDTNDPTGNLRIKDHIEHLTFQKIRLEDLSSVAINNVVLSDPDPDWGNFGWLLFPKRKCPFNSQRLTSVQQVIDSYGILDWPNWGDLGFLGDPYPDTYGKVKGGGWLKGILWHGSGDSVTAIPKWGQSPRVCAIDPETGNLRWDRRGWEDFSETGTASYELYTTVAISGDTLLVHVERFDWEERVIPGIPLEARMAFERFRTCAPEHTRADTITADGSTATFLLSTDSSSTSTDYGKGIKPGAMVYVNGCLLPASEYTISNNPGINAKIRLVFNQKPVGGTEIEVTYRPFTPCDFGDEGTTGSACNAERKAKCWSDAHFVLDPYVPSDWPGFSVNCPPTSGGSDWWTGGYCRPPVTGGAVQPSFVAPADTSVLLNANASVVSALDDMLSGATVNLQVPVKWRQFYRTYNVLTGEQIGEIPAAERTCDYKPRQYSALRNSSDYQTATCSASNQTLSPTPLASGELGGNGVGGASFGTNGILGVRHFTHYPGLIEEWTGQSCFFERGCVYIWGGTEYELVGSPFTVSAFSPSVIFSPCAATYTSYTEQFDNAGEYSADHVDARVIHYQVFRWSYIPEDMPGIVQHMKLPWLTWNAVACPEGDGFYFLPGRAWPKNPDPSVNTTPGADMPSGKTPGPYARSPIQGPQAGGTSVTVTGWLMDTVTSVTLGGSPVAFTILSPTQVRFTTPPHAAATLDIVVSNSHGANVPFPGFPLTFRYI